MADNFYAYFYKQKKDGISEGDTQHTPLLIDESVVVQDDLIGKPWTHRFTIYCENPPKAFLKDLQGNKGVVAVYTYVKEGQKPTAESIPSAPNI